MDTNNKASLILAKKMIALMDSERGLQAKLSKSIGKTSASFSGIRHGRPVNADHLRAVGIVCGPKILLEILSLENIQDWSHEPEPLKPPDLKLMGDIIEGLETILQEEGTNLSPDKKRRLIELLFKYFKKTGEDADKGVMKEHLRLIAA